MSGSESQISLKPYLEKIATACNEVSKQDLIDVILGMAKEEPTSQRVAFLQKIQSFMPETKSADKIVTDVETILDEIQALKEAIAERIEAIENGDYEYLDDWDWDDYHYDDEPDYISEEQIEALTDLFQDVENLFFNDQIEDSITIYEALFNLKKKIDNNDYALSELDVDFREERARYARCVYDTSDKNKRLDKFAAVMELDASHRYNEFKINESYPLLQDVIDAREGEMADLQSFVPTWKNLLVKMEIKGRPASLLIEVVNRLQGIEGVAKLARAWKNNQPHGYLFWLNCLKTENRLDDIVEVSKEALQVFKKGDARETVSRFLIEAGELLDNPEYVLEGIREKLFSKPCDDNLLGLQKEAIKQNKRGELETVLSFFAKQQGMNDDGKSLYLKGLLMAGRLDDAFLMVKKSKSLGWSYGLNIGLVFGAVVLAVTDSGEHVTTIEDLLAGYADKNTVYSYQINIKEDDDDITFHDEIIKGIKKNKFPKSKLVEYFNWALRIGRNRIDDIVSKQHRGAYKRAAQVLCSLAEVYVATKDVKKATKIIHEYCKEKYNRHSAFKREVNTVISGSRLLKNIVISA
ncbi:MAG: hypothetical protein PF482_17660 [Desulfobacteraceae bacterium]|jgi:hypothetical protein|nr:hypothetical protein [Desulfobacteraceae bacterium]